VVLMDDLFNLQTHQRICAHPANLLADGRETVKVGAVQVEEHGHDVRLPILNAGKPPDSDALQHIDALFSAQLVNQHSERYRI